MTVAVQSETDRLDFLDLSTDLMTLIRWANESLPSAQVPCVCNDGGCLRCQTEEIVARHQAKKRHNAERAAARVTGMMPF